MIPQTVGALAALLFLVAPGLVFQLLRERRQPRIERAPFREVSVVALTSLLFSLAAAGLVAAARLTPVGREALPNPSRWLLEGNRYVASNLGRVTWFVVAQLTMAVLLAWLVERITAQRRPPVLRQGSLWFRAFRENAPAGTSPFVRVTVAGGTEYFGLIASYTADDVPLNERELELATPILVRQAGEAQPRPVPDAWSRLLIPGGIIEGVAVAYLRA